MSTPADKDKDKSAPAAAPTPAAKDPAPATNGDEAEAADGKAEGKDKEAAAAPKAPHPLDGLSQAELRKKLDGSKQGLRAYLERKKKLDQELVSGEQIEPLAAQLPQLARHDKEPTVDPALARAGQLGSVHLRV